MYLVIIVDSWTILGNSAGGYFSQCMDAFIEPFVLFRGPLGKRHSVDLGIRKVIRYIFQANW